MSAPLKIAKGRPPRASYSLLSMQLHDAFTADIFLQYSGTVPLHVIFDTALSISRRSPGVSATDIAQYFLPVASAWSCQEWNDPWLLRQQPSQRTRAGVASFVQRACQAITTLDLLSAPRAKAGTMLRNRRYQISYSRRSSGKKPLPSGLNGTNPTPVPPRRYHFRSVL